MSRRSGQPSSSASPDVRLDSVEVAVRDFRAGHPIVIADGTDREDEGDLVLSAQFATPALIAFMMVRCRGLICAPMHPSALDRLEIGLMVPRPGDDFRTAFTVSVDARIGVTTGISAADRARTIRALSDPLSVPDDFVRPGHLFPLRAVAAGILERPGHTEAALEVARLAELEPAGVICEIADEAGAMMRRPDLRRFADAHGLAMISIAQLASYVAHPWNGGPTHHSAAGPEPLGQPHGGGAES